MNDRQLVRVRDVMKHDFDVIDGMTTVAEMLATIENIDAKAVIVDKRHEADEYGMVLISDIARHVLAKDRAPERVNVYEIMAKPVITVDPNMDIRYCARLFERFHLTRAPVLNKEGTIIGIVSFTDMVMRGLKR